MDNESLRKYLEVVEIENLELRIRLGIILLVLSELVIM